MGRLIKRYGNRKLYDTRESRYITLDEIADFVRVGEDVTVIENVSGTDLTGVAFAQIILEEERRHSGFLSLPLLRDLIQQSKSMVPELSVPDMGELSGKLMSEGLSNGSRREESSG